MQLNTSAFLHIYKICIIIDIKKFQVSPDLRFSVKFGIQCEDDTNFLENMVETCGFLAII